MDDGTLLYWGVVVTLFLFFAFLLTAQELFERYMEQREEEEFGDPENTD